MTVMQVSSYKLIPSDVDVWASTNWQGRRDCQLPDQLAQYISINFNLGQNGSTTQGPPSLNPWQLIDEAEDWHHSMWGA